MTNNTEQLPELRHVVHCMEVAIRFAKSGIRPTEEEATEWTAALSALRAAPQQPGSGHSGSADGWFLPRDAVNDIQAESIDRLIRRAKGAHYADVDLRINGQNEFYQADWIKYMERRVTAASPLVQQAGQPPGKTALEQFNECAGADIGDPIERLRFFCSFAMNGQDWLDSNSFFDAASLPEQPQPNAGHSGSSDDKGPNVPPLEQPALHVTRPDGAQITYYTRDQVRVRDLLWLVKLAAAQNASSPQQGEQSALEQDAKRYRWLRDKANRSRPGSNRWMKFRNGEISVLQHCDRDESNILHGSELDAAIDSAMLAGRTIPHSGEGE